MRIQNSVVKAILIVTAVSFLQLGCSKDKFTTKPKLSIKSVNSYTVNRGDLIIFDLEVRDKEGDISDSIYIQNRTSNCPASDYSVPAAYKIPEFPSTPNQKAELQIVFENGTNNTGNVIYSGNRCLRTDTTTFYFWVKDKAKNVSDTVKTDKPLVIKI